MRVTDRCPAHAREQRSGRLSHMRLVRRLISGIALAVLPLITASAGAMPILSDGGQTITDNGISWLANSNLAMTMTFGVRSCTPTITGNCINASGSMDYDAALNWIAGMNQADYLGHNNWQLPATPTVDQACSATGKFGNSFGFGCTLGALSSLYQMLGGTAPQAVVPPTSDPTGPFKNLQPGLYWSGSVSPFSANGNGYLTFSFANGLQNSDLGVNITDPANPTRVTSVSGIFLNVLPMYPGPLLGIAPTGSTDLQVSPDGQSVYDPILNLTWPTDANLSASNSFGIARCNGVGSKGVNGAPPCISDAGTMNWTTAQQFVTAMNNSAYLGGTNWQLPPILDANCKFSGCANANDPMAYLFYNWLGFPPGGDIHVFSILTGLFNGIQPYFYWSCVANDNLDPQLSGCSDQSASPGLYYDFSFESGFLNTDLLTTDNFVTAYYVDAPEPQSLPIFLTGLGFMAVLACRRSRSQAAPVGPPAK